MARKKCTFNLDTRILAELAPAAEAAGYPSINRFVETGLWELLKMAGRIPADADPLPEMRGKSRKKMEQD